jgi:hypothetical protein
MQSSALQAPGSYIRLIVAASQGVGGRPVPMSEIRLNAEERRGVMEVVSYHWATAAEHLTVEQCVQWGALVLFLVAGAPDLGPLRELLDQGVTAEQLESIRRGGDLLDRSRVMGGTEAFHRLHAAVLSVGGPQPHASTGERARRAQPVFAIEAEPMRPVLGRHRIRVRVMSTSVEGTDADTVTVMLVVPSRANIILRIDDAPGGKLVDDGVALQIGEDWTEILCFG